MDSTKKNKSEVVGCLEWESTAWHAAVRGVAKSWTWLGGWTAALAAWRQGARSCHHLAYHDFRTSSSPRHLDLQASPAASCFRCTRPRVWSLCTDSAFPSQLESIVLFSATEFEGRTLYRPNKRKQFPRYCCGGGPFPFYSFWILVARWIIKRTQNRLAAEKETNLNFCTWRSHRSKT